MIGWLFDVILRLFGVIGWIFGVIGWIFGVIVWQFDVIRWLFYPMDGCRRGDYYRHKNLLMYP